MGGAVSFYTLHLRIFGVRRNLCKEKDFSTKIAKVEGILMQKFLACFLICVLYSSIFVVTVIWFEERVGLICLWLR